MKKLFFFLSLALFTFMTEAFAVSFVDGHEDIPIMDGLSQVENDNVSFGNEESRFVEAYLTGKGFSFEQVERFYMETMPQLGWYFSEKGSKSMIFKRDNEIMEIVLEKSTPMLVRITVKSGF